MTINRTSAAPSQSVQVMARVRSFPRDRFAPRDLHAAVGRGDRLARAVVWNRHASDVRELLYGYLGRNAAGDLVHDVFAAFFYSAAELDDARSTRAHLIAKAQRVALFAERSRRTGLPPSTTDNSTLDDASPEHLLSTSDALDRVEAIMKQVAARSTLAFLVRYDVVTTRPSRGRTAPIHRRNMLPCVVAVALGLGATLTLLVAAQGASVPQWQHLDVADASVGHRRFDIADGSRIAFRARAPEEAAGEALAGRMRTLLATGHGAAAKAAARDYVERYPDGIHVAAAQHVWDSQR